MSKNDQNFELPDNLKKLYRHWEFHTAVLRQVRRTDATELPVAEPAETIFQKSELFSELKSFINERNTIWKKKVSDANLPFTDDPILSKYRFCNIFREFDRQTIEFHTLLNPLRDDFPLWLLNMFYCRMVANIETINHVGLLSFDLKHNEQVYNRLVSSPRPRYGTPYVFPVSVILKSDYPTRELFVCNFLPKIMKQVAELISYQQKISVCSLLEKVLPVFGFNLSFLWTEVLIDVAYQYPYLIDLYAEFPVGPGSKPTMERIYKQEKPSLLVVKLSEIQFSTGITFDGNELQLSAENWEGIGCEFRKYTNLKSGKGRKRVYKK